MRSIARIFGVFLIVTALWGFVDAGFGLDTVVLIEIFPVNVLHNIAHLLLGIWGYASSQQERAAGHYCRWAGVIFLVLGGVGYAVENPLDLFPLGGADRFLHLGLGAVLLVAGLVDAARPQPGHRRR